MSKHFIAVLLLVILVSACSRPVAVPAVPSVTPFANNLFPTVTPTPLIVTSTAAPAAAPTESSCPAPATRVEVGQEVMVLVEDWDKLKLRSEPAVSAGNVTMELEQFSQLKILDGPVCAYSAETGYSYWFWKVVVLPSAETGWVAEGDYSHYFIQTY